MRQTLCNRLSIILICLSVFILSAKAQDSLKTVTPPSQKKTTQAPSPAKTVARPETKASSTQAQQTTASPAKPLVKAAPAKPVDNSLNGQYEDLLKHSWMQQGYKVVQPARLTTLWKSVTDSLNYHKKVSAEAKQKISEQEKLIGELKSPVDGEQKASEHSQVAVVNEIQILGMSIDTATYNWIVWGTILILALALAGILFSTTKNSSDSKHHKQLYEELSSEYQSYKAKAKEKELKLARELQTERNTVEELLAKKNEDDSGKNRRI